MSGFNSPAAAAHDHRLLQEFCHALSIFKTFQWPICVVVSVFRIVMHKKACTMAAAICWIRLVEAAIRGIRTASRLLDSTLEVNLSHTKQALRCVDARVNLGFVAMIHMLPVVFNSNTIIKNIKILMSDYQEPVHCTKSHVCRPLRSTSTVSSGY